MKTRQIGLLSASLILAFLTALLTAGQKNDQAEVALKAAMNRELVDGDLKSVIVQYEKIIKTFPDKREIGAKALLRIGMCYEKLGKEEAQRAYQQIIREYGDQPAVVTDARARLVSLTSAARPAEPARTTAERPAFTIRRIAHDEIGRTHQARLSPDGRKLLYIHVQDDEPRYSIRVMELSSGKSHTLFDGITFGANNIFIWSPDGKRVVFKHGRGELRLIGSDGGKSEVLWSAPDDQTGVYPLDWSLDDRNILISLKNDSTGKTDLVMLPLAGGTPRVIVSGKSNEIAELAHLSPDAKYIAGMKRIGKNTDIYVWPVDGGKETRITENPADDEYPFWSPDGRYIVFASNQTGTIDLWGTPMNGPNPTGAPVKLRANLGKNAVLTGLTPGGRLTMYGIGSTGTPADLFALPVNPKTGEAQGEFRRYARSPVGSVPLWSPDGTRGAYTSRKGNIQLPNVYIIEGGEKQEVEIPAKNHFIGNIEWSRDGKYLIFPGWNNEDRRIGIFRVSPDNSAIEPLLLGEPYGKGFQGSYVNLQWLPIAGKYMVEKFLNENEKEIYVLDQGCNNVQRIAGNVDAAYYTWPSPDGRYLVCRTKDQNLNLFSVQDSTSLPLVRSYPKELPISFAWSPDGGKVAWSEGGQLRVYSVRDSAFQTVVQTGASRKISGISGWTNKPWSPDGSKIAYVLEDISTGSGPRGELWVVPATGGTPRRTASAPSGYPMMNSVSWHPSGRTIYVIGSAGTESVIYEHWIMENFLPPLKPIR